MQWKVDFTQNQLSKNVGMVFINIPQELSLNWGQPHKTDVLHFSNFINYILFTCMVTAIYSTMMTLHIFGSDFKFIVILCLIGREYRKQVVKNF